MNLIDLISNINEVDEDSIIFLKDYKSDIILSYPKDGDNGIKKENGSKYHYLLEVFLAKEFIEDWMDSLDYSPSQEVIAKRVYEYGMNDA